MSAQDNQVYVETYLGHEIYFETPYFSSDPKVNNKPLASVDIEDIKNGIARFVAEKLQETLQDIIKQYDLPATINTDAEDITEMIHMFYNQKVREFMDYGFNDLLNK